MQMIQSVLNYVGYFTTIIVIFAAIRECYRWITGITPVLLRLGKGLACRKIAIFADPSNFNSLRNLLVDSKLFKKKNIIQIDETDIEKGEKYSLFLVHWKSMGAHIDRILNNKKDETALLIYAPQEDGRIEQKDIEMLNTHRNFLLVNFRGRLLNDIVVSLITTSYEQ